MEEKEAEAESSAKKNENKLTGNEHLNKELEKLEEWIDSMDRSTIIRFLKKNNENPHGQLDAIRRRLKYCMRKRKIAIANGCTDVRTLFPFYVVLDFEATCNAVNPPDYPHEIIEFPAVLVDTQKMKVVDKFQAFVKPVINPVLSDFCKELTGITQEQVDSSQEFPQVLAQFEDWLDKHKLGTKNKFAMVTDGPWDMGRFLYGQCQISNIPYPDFGKRWVNLRKIFSIFYKCERVKGRKKRKKKKFKMRLQLMLERLGLQFEGHPHCGMDDTVNIAQLMLRMIQDGASIDNNERIQLRYKLDRKETTATSGANDENRDDNKSESKWPVKQMHGAGMQRTYSQALKERAAASAAFNRLRAEMKRHHINAPS